MACFSYFEELLRRSVMAGDQRPASAARAPSCFTASPRV